MSAASTDMVPAGQDPFDFDSVDWGNLSSASAWASRPSATKSKQLIDILGSPTLDPLADPVEVVKDIIDLDSTPEWTPPDVSSQPAAPFAPLSLLEDPVIPEAAPSVIADSTAAVAEAAPVDTDIILGADALGADTPAGTLPEAAVSTETAAPKAAAAACTSDTNPAVDSAGASQSPADAQADGLVDVGLTAPADIAVPTAAASEALAASVDTSLDFFPATPAPDARLPSTQLPGHALPHASVSPAAFLPEFSDFATAFAAPASELEVKPASEAKLEPLPEIPAESVSMPTHDDTFEQVSLDSPQDGSVSNPDLPLPPRSHSLGLLPPVLERLKSALDSDIGFSHPMADKPDDQVSTFSTSPAIPSKSPSIASGSPAVPPKSPALSQLSKKQSLPSISTKLDNTLWKMKSFVEKKKSQDSTKSRIQPLSLSPGPPVAVEPGESIFKFELPPAVEPSAATTRKQPERRREISYSGYGALFDPSGPAPAFSLDDYLHSLTAAFPTSQHYLDIRPPERIITKFPRNWPLPNATVPIWRDGTGWNSVSEAALPPEDMEWPLVRSRHFRQYQRRKVSALVSQSSEKAQTPVSKIVRDKSGRLYLDVPGRAPVEIDENPNRKKSTPTFGHYMSSEKVEAILREKAEREKKHAAALSLPSPEPEPQLDSKSKTRADTQSGSVSSATSALSLFGITASASNPTKSVQKKTSEVFPKRSSSKSESLASSSSPGSQNQHTRESSEVYREALRASYLAHGMSILDDLNMAVEVPDQRISFDTMTFDQSETSWSARPAHARSQSLQNVKSFRNENYEPPPPKVKKVRRFRRNSSENIDPERSWMELLGRLALEPATLVVEPTLLVHRGFTSNPHAFGIELEWDDGMYQRTVRAESTLLVGNAKDGALKMQRTTGVGKSAELRLEIRKELKQIESDRWMELIGNRLRIMRELGQVLGDWEQSDSEPEPEPFDSIASEMNMLPLGSAMGFTHRGLGRI
ncbi:uncharacterized protein BJ171DRAFT_470743 [Polychytrium aggregatum]|uniref:uncharacterized protein n=1 Tax=Polychytrium aggregatum TaxID=110093 RepID=UPI0022FDD0E0|nr:uncharacterized protein BJ171DRAFT_470743 [Polychytrium aggregatum]KAI9209811.1 hypothetical protein BJ171DRAFT_470743 [Polychytrium aggregatum]